MRRGQGNPRLPRQLRQRQLRALGAERVEQREDLAGDRTHGYKSSTSGRPRTRSPYFAGSSSRNAIEDLVRPPYTSCQSAPAASAAATIETIGVMPIPPAMNRYRGDSMSAKLLRGP